MIDIKALQKQVANLEADLKPTGLASDRLKIEWRAAKNADRTAATFETWVAERVTQVAVAWVLATVFVRFCEDNGLIEYPFIAGPEDRVQLAADLQAKHYENHPASDDLGWLKAAIEALSVSPVAKGLFDRRHNPMWTIEPSPQAIKALLAFWRDRRGRAIRHDLRRRWNTRFLGDLYQDCPSGAENLRPAPDAGVRRGVHPQLHPRPGDRRVRPGTRTAARPRGPATRLRVIDPACGSGHFLLDLRRLLHSLGGPRPRRLTGMSWSPRPCRPSTAWTRTRSRPPSPASASCWPPCAPRAWSA